MDRVVRAATALDLDKVMAVEQAAREAPHWSREAYAEIVAEHDPEASLQRQMFVAECGGKLTGFAVGSMISGNASAELESIAVLESERRHGTGSVLCAALLTWCRDAGAEYAELEVRASNAAAIRFYETLGFFQQGVRPRYYRDPEEDAALMRADLRGCG